MNKNRNRSRQFIYSMLAASLMVTAVPVAAGAEGGKPVMAETLAKESSQESATIQESKISRDEAIEIAKKVAGNVDGYDGPNVSRRSGRMGPYENHNVWEIRWMKRGPQYSHVEVAVDADTGLIRQFWKSEEQEKSIKLPPKVKYEDAVKIAKDFVDNNYGEQLKNFQYDQREGEEWGKVIRGPQDAYEVRFVEKVNGIPFPQNHLSVRINGDGELVNLYYNSLGNVRFADANGVLSKQEFMKKLEQVLQMRLAYQIQLDMHPLTGKVENRKVYVSYDPSPSFFLLNAKTGEAVDYQGKVIHASKGGDAPLAETKQAEPPQKLAKPLTQDEALKRLQQLMKIPAEITVSSFHLEEWAGRKAWHIQFEYHSGNHGMGWTGGIIDAETGQILQFDIANYFREKNVEKMNAADQAGKEAKPKAFPVSKELAREKALAFLKEHSKDKLHQLYVSAHPVEEPEAVSPFYRFSFERRVNGVLVPFNPVSVTVSAETGEIVEFRQEWHWDMKWPETGNVIVPEKAKEIYLKDLNLRLEYQLMNEKELYRYRDQPVNNKPLDAQLVYRVVQEVEEPVFIDAVTGKLISLRTGDEAAKKSGGEAGIADIRGHWAEKELKYLAEIGAIEAKEGKLQPNAEISRGEFIDMFMGVMDGNFRRHYYPGDRKENPTFNDVPSTHKYFGPVEWAVERGILKKAEHFKPDAPLTREEAANIIIQALGYSKLAQKGSLFKLEFADAKAIDYPGEVAIVSGIGIMNGDGTNFHPDQAMTRAQAAVTLFKFLEKRGEY